MTECEICKITTSKYKCPICALRYCSVPCYKCHKENCKQEVEVQKDVFNVSKDELAEQPYEFETKDTVPLQKLQLLRYNNEIRTCLQNPHLRRMLRYLNSCTQPSVEIAHAMKEPIFYEFANACVKTVGEAESSEDEE